MDSIHTLGGVPGRDCGGLFVVFEVLPVLLVEPVYRVGKRINRSNKAPKRLCRVARIGVGGGRSGIGPCLVGKARDFAIHGFPFSF